MRVRSIYQLVRCAHIKLTVILIISRHAWVYCISPDLHAKLAVLSGRTAPVDWRQQSTETFLPSMDSVGYDNALKHLEEIGSTFRKDTRKRLRELEDKYVGQRRWGLASTPSTPRWSVPRIYLLFDLHPTEAIKRGVFWFWPRVKQSNAASEELLELMRHYWHSDEVSRQHGDSAERDMCDDFIDLGRTIFFSTRCKCLVLPDMEQCACKIHSQQMAAAGGGKRGSTWAHSPMRWPAPRPTCGQRTRRVTAGWGGNALDCAKCGFGGAGGISIYSKLENSEQTVVWKMFEDVITAPASGDGKIKAKKLANQTVPKEDKLCDLWSAFKGHTKLYMAHHSIAKWQRHCHGRCLETFQDGDLVVIESDFAEKVPVTEIWIIFASEDMAHDCNFYLHGLARMADYYLRGDGSEATAAARK
ncbi:unnamed protein product [Ectocarpus sp. CCAP 1310/34]|nr:unnamed protein product [Ectocarpus sp. CCAP 1310/34]